MVHVVHSRIYTNRLEVKTGDFEMVIELDPHNQREITSDAINFRKLIFEKHPELKP